jgi:2Fe-2S iron-sulfur cluster binding domain
MDDKLEVTLDEAAKSVSRRNFIKGVIAGGVAASSTTYLFRTSSLLSQQPPGLGERLITLTVNGQQRRVDVAKQETLAWTLRYKLGLTGTKLGCDRAECGACTVLLDDIPHYSCSVLTHTARGRNILTIEGLANPEWGAASSPASVDEQGFQCAFCMPGFIM